ncbi:ABC transporter transmembrane domain-containing protein [Inquilinus sp. CAU 1745]|uniref:ABC transporter transmembrane domain-containing protein n=1 Tax=Inquilinus sp. CAU 1745 TaxID=3140369 RepID=UPI00325B8A74
MEGDARKRRQDGDAGPRPGRADLKPLRRILPYLAPYKAAVAGAVVALSVAAGTVLGLGAGLRLLVDRGFAAGDASLLNGALLVLLGVIVVLAASSYARFYLVSWIGERVIADLRRDVYDHVVRLHTGFFETNRTAEIISRLTADTTVLQVVIGSSASVFLRNLLMFLGGTVLLVVTSPKLTGLVALVVPLVVVPIIVFGRQVRGLSRDSQDRIADMGATVDETLYGIRTVQAFGREGLERDRFADRVETAFATSVRRIRARALLTAIVILMVFGAVGIILWIGGHDVLSGRITPGELSAFVFYAVLVAGSVGALSEVVGDLQRAAGATERLFGLMETPSDITAPASPTRLPTPPRGAIGFDGVSFHYPSRPDQSALEDFTLDIAPGESVALVGPSGAGKTTVFQLLLRFYDPQAGSIRMDGIDIRDADPADLRSRIGLVPQDPTIFSTSAWENIRYGRPDASDAEVSKAAEAAHALEFIEALPEGFSTYLGERGVRLSGGQRQRIAIARAILRDPVVLLLDEATSALDAESERLVQDALTRLMADRTTLVIAHRLATVQNVDRIAVLDQGRLVAAGAHDALMAEGGLYARLAALQFDAARGAHPPSYVIPDLIRNP